MKVKELIKRLESCNPEADVEVTDGVEGAHYDIDSVDELSGAGERLSVPVVSLDIRTDGV